MSTKLQYPCEGCQFVWTCSLYTTIGCGLRWSDIVRALSPEGRKTLWQGKTGFRRVFRDLPQVSLHRSGLDFPLE